METVCSTCGEQNPPGTQFCQRCLAFLAWEDAAPATRPPGPTRDQPLAEELIETRVMPKIRPAEPAEAAPARRSAPPPTAAPVGPVPVPLPMPVPDVLRVALPTDPVILPVDGSPVELALTIRNLSDIVDGYAVDVGGAPPWLVVASD